MMTLFLSLTMVTTMSLPFMSTPYALGSAFMMVLVFLSAYMMSVGPLWFPITMFLIYVGALMVLFLYMTCLSPNMRIERPWPAIAVGTVLSAVIMLAYWGLSVTLYSPVHSEVNFTSISTSMTKTQAPTDLISYSKGDILVFSGLALFFSLLSVVKICKHQKGPLRPFKRSPITPPKIAFLSSPKTSLSYKRVYSTSPKSSLKRVIICRNCDLCHIGGEGCCALCCSTAQYLGSRRVAVYKCEIPLCSRSHWWINLRQCSQCRKITIWQRTLGKNV